jgi:hypothetical protein
MATASHHQEGERAMRVEVTVHNIDNMEASAWPGPPLSPTEGNVTVGSLVIRGSAAALRLLAERCEQAAALADDQPPETDKRGEWDQAGADPDARPPGMAPYADGDDFGPGT